MNSADTGRWLPTTRKEIENLGWEQPDVIIFSGDAYVDHPSFGPAVIGRVLEAKGLKVAIVPQPNWQDDLRDFRKLGVPKLFFAVSAGNMDSMVNRYTAGKRLRAEDAFTPDGRHTGRPDYPTIIYTRILKELFPDSIVVAGGIEASMRRLSHYDYWQDRLLPSILVDSKADYLVYGMGEQPMSAIADALIAGTPEAIREIPQVSYLVHRSEMVSGQDDIILHSHEECLDDKLCQAYNFRLIEEQSNVTEAKRIIQGYKDYSIVVNPPYPPMTTQMLDSVYDLPFTRMPHPRYRGKRIPAYEMIRHSITLHRGCFGGCAFCTISAHQGKQIVSRSKESILREVEAIVRMEDFKGYISDLGGPSANMYGLSGRDKTLCNKCRRASCLYPKVCRNLNTDLTPLIEIYRAVDKIPGVKKSCIGSGIRYDILLHKSGNAAEDASKRIYTEELVRHHVSGRLKVAPEHTSDHVLQLMRKPSFSQFREFKRLFDTLNREAGLRQQIIPYFISSHPACTTQDMAELAIITKGLNFHLEQIQDFTPTPMTLSTEIFYTGIDPYTRKEVFTAHSRQEKEAQRMFFFWYDTSERDRIIKELRRIGRRDLIDRLFKKN